MSPEFSLALSYDVYKWCSLLILYWFAITDVHTFTCIYTSQVFYMLNKMNKIYYKIINKGSNSDTYENVWVFYLQVINSAMFQISYININTIILIVYKMSCES